tara:strand:- start:1067 stop:2941 length:1875 start_codon:yes stop_codon:yes gene_type:complete
MTILSDVLEDTAWLRQAFLLRKSDIDDVDKKRRVFSMASTKYTDTTLGGNYTINNPPQFTRHADIKAKAPFSPSKGMGRYYSEAIDDNSITLHMRFGVAEYNSLTTFFTNFFDSSMGTLARTGESTGVLYNIGKVAGFLFAIPLLPFVVAGRIYRFLDDKPYSKYYYLKPTMPLYWGAVNTIVDNLAVNMGLIGAADIDSYTVNADGKAEPNYEAGLTSKEIEAFNKLLPDVFRGDGGVDIYAIANRAQRIRNRQIVLQQAALQNATTSEGLATAARRITEQDIGPVPAGSSLKDYMARYHSTSMAQGADANKEKQDPIGSWESGFFEHLSSELSDGSHWVSFKVNPDRSINESFSNTTGESDIANKINGMSSSARSARFSTLDGNIGDGVISGAIEGIIGGAKDVISGVADGVGLSGLAALGGRAFVDIPEHWQDSVAELPSESYTLELRAPYGNKMSIFTNIYVPLAMILAGALPLSTGAQSYTSPFLCDLFVKGRQQSRLSIIDSVSITRGVGNIGWSVDHLPTGIDVTISVKDLSTVMHMPLNDSPGLFDDDSSFSDYMGILGGLGLTEQFYPVQKLKRRFVQSAQEFDKWTSPAFYAQHVSASVPGRILAAVARNTGRG